MNRLLFFLAVMASAQTPNPTFRTGTELIQVSVVAQDKQGKPVTDLKREEFSLRDNGLPQAVRTFAAEQAVPTPPLLTAPNIFTNQIGFTNQIAPGPGSAAGSHSGYSVILIDNLLASFGDPTTQEEGSGLARVQTLKMLRSMPPGEKIAIYATKRKVQIICEFTSDRDLLERQLRLWTPSPDNPDTSAAVFKDPGGGMPRYNAEQYAAAVERQADEDARVDMMLRASASGDQMEQIADHLAGVPGRKNLIWLSNRFAISGRAMQKFNRDNVALYPVDMDGVCRLCSPRPTAIMDAIASATGGVAYYKRNDIDTAIREAIDDGRVTYTLGFYQSSQDQSGQNDEPTVHQLAVAVSRPGVTLRYRTSYESEAPKGPETAATELVAALNRPVNETAIPFQTSVTRAGDRLKLEVRLDAASLDLIQQKGLWAGRIECLARFVTADGTFTGADEPQTMMLNLRQASYDAALQHGLPYKKELIIPMAAVELRLLFANVTTGKIGTLTIPLYQVKENNAN